MSKGRKHTRRKALSEEVKEQLRERSNKCISRYCNYAALVIILVALASYVVGKGDVFFSQFGIMVSIALLAIAAINDPARK